MSKTETATGIPMPGSDRAIKLGCKCHVLDNARGLGYLGGVKGKDGKRVYVISGNCDLHREWEPVE
jgi:hypothetical protein